MSERSEQKPHSQQLNRANSSRPVIERAKRAKATLGAAKASKASQVGEASEVSKPTCISYYGLMGAHDAYRYVSLVGKVLMKCLTMSEPLRL